MGIKKIVLSGVVIGFMTTIPAFGQTEFHKTLRWFATKADKTNLEEIQNDPVLSALEKVDLEQKISELSELESNESIQKSIKEWRSKEFEKSSNLILNNTTHGITFRKYKGEVGGYNELIFGKSYSSKYTEDYTKYFDSSDDRSKTCDENFLFIKQAMKKPDLMRDLSFPTLHFNGLGLASDKLSAQWNKDNFVVHYDCVRWLSTKQFYDDGTVLTDLSKLKAKQVQSALNFFGFDVGKVDGAFGKRSRLGLQRMQQCLGQIFNSGVILDSEIEFLLNSYSKVSQSKSQSSCDELYELLPRKSLVHYEQVTVLPSAYSTPIQPIAWLRCEYKKRRMQLFILGGADETQTVSEKRIFGIDYQDNVIFSEVGSKLSLKPDISETDIQFTLSSNAKDKYFDRVIIDYNINRLTGDILEKANFSKNNKTTSIDTSTGVCNLLDPSTRKF